MRSYAKITTALLIALSILLSGCASSGTKVSAEQATKFVKGKTTYADVISKLGKPDMISTTSDGGKTISYIYHQTETTLVSYVPILGSLVGGVNNEGSTASFSFNKKSILTDYAASESGSDINTGFLNGRKQ